MNYADFVPIVQGDKKYYGGSQNWYDRFTMRFGGCGPIALANMFAYKALHDPKFRALAPKMQGSAYSLEQYKQYSQAIYEMVKPVEVFPFNRWSDYGNQLVLLPTLGVPTQKILIKGAQRYLKHHHLKASAVTYQGDFKKDDVSLFIMNALNKDQPVALLNRLSKIDMRYRVKKGATYEVVFDRHWVTITGHYRRQRSGEIILLASSWGCRSALSLDALIESQRRWGSFLPPALVYFD